MRKNYCPHVDNKLHKLHVELICFSYDLAPKGTLSDRKVLINIYQLLINDSFENILHECYSVHKEFKAMGCCHIEGLGESLETT